MLAPFRERYGSARDIQPVQTACRVAVIFRHPSNQTVDNVRP
jgi:hypothetical protein